MNFRLPEHAANDAFILRNRNVPEFRKAQIIGDHANEIERQARLDKHSQIWIEGQLPAKALLAASYINSMFLDAFRNRQIVSPTSVAELYAAHIGMIREGVIMNSSPLGYTALSAMTYAADRVQGMDNNGGLLAYACIPETRPELDIAS